MSQLVETNLVVSAGVIFGTILISEIIRRVSIRLISKDEIVLRLILEFVAAFELISVALERGVLGLAYGQIGLSTPLFIVSIWRTFYWINIKACPYSILEEWIARKINKKTLVVLIALEFAGGCLAFTYYKYVWSYGFSGAHQIKYARINESCRVPIQGDYIEAAVYEAGYAFVFGLTCRFLYSVIPNSKLAPIIKATVFTYLVMSGGIFNPLLATVLLFGCTGITPLQHIVIYWIGSSFGAILSYYVWKVVYVDRQKPQKVVTKAKKTS